MQNVGEDRKHLAQLRESIFNIIQITLCENSGRLERIDEYEGSLTVSTKCGMRDFLPSATTFDRICEIFELDESILIKEVTDDFLTESEFYDVLNVINFLKSEYSRDSFIEALILLCETTPKSSLFLNEIFDDFFNACGSNISMTLSRPMEISDPPRSSLPLASPVSEQVCFLFLSLSNDVMTRADVFFAISYGLCSEKSSVRNQTFKFLSRSMICVLQCLDALSKSNPNRRRGASLAVDPLDFVLTGCNILQTVISHLKSLVVSTLTYSSSHHPLKSKKNFSPCSFSIRSACRLPSKLPPFISSQSTATLGLLKEHCADVLTVIAGGLSLVSNFVKVDELYKAILDVAIILILDAQSVKIRARALETLVTLSTFESHSSAANVQNFQKMITDICLRNTHLYYYPHYSHLMMKNGSFLSSSLQQENENEMRVLEQDRQSSISGKSASASSFVESSWNQPSTATIHHRIGVKTPSRRLPSSLSQQQQQQSMLPSSQSSSQNLFSYTSQPNCNNLNSSVTSAHILCWIANRVQHQSCTVRIETELFFQPRIVIPQRIQSVKNPAEAAARLTEFLDAISPKIFPIEQLPFHLKSNVVSNLEFLDKNDMSSLHDSLANVLFSNNPVCNQIPASVRESQPSNDASQRVIATPNSSSSSTTLSMLSTFRHPSRVSPLPPIRSPNITSASQPSSTQNHPNTAETSSPQNTFPPQGYTHFHFPCESSSPLTMQQQQVQQNQQQVPSETFHSVQDLFSVTKANQQQHETSSQASSTVATPIKRLPPSTRRIQPGQEEEQQQLQQQQQIQQQQQQQQQQQHVDLQKMSIAPSIHLVDEQLSADSPKWTARTTRSRPLVDRRLLRDDSTAPPPPELLSDPSKLLLNEKMERNLETKKKTTTVSRTAGVREQENSLKRHGESAPSLVVASKFKDKSKGVSYVEDPNDFPPLTGKEKSNSSWITDALFCLTEVVKLDTPPASDEWEILFESMDTLRRALVCFKEIFFVGPKSPRQSQQQQTYPCSEESNNLNCDLSELAVSAIRNVIVLIDCPRSALCKNAMLLIRDLFEYLRVHASRFIDGACRSLLRRVADPQTFLSSSATEAILKIAQHGHQTRTITVLASCCLSNSKLKAHQSRTALANAIGVFLQRCSNKNAETALLLLAELCLDANSETRGNARRGIFDFFTLGRYPMTSFETLIKTKFTSDANRIISFLGTAKT